MIWSQIDAAAEFVAECTFAAVRSIRREVCSSNQRVPKYLKVSAKRRSQARSCADEHGPGTSAADRAMRAQGFDIDTEPVAVIPGDRGISSVLILCNVGELVKSHEGVTDVGLPGIVFEDALYFLRLRPRRRREYRRACKNSRHKDILSDQGWGSDGCVRTKGRQRKRGNIALRDGRGAGNGCIQAGG